MQLVARDMPVQHSLALLHYYVLIEIWYILDVVEIFTKVLRLESDFRKEFGVIRDNSCGMLYHTDKLFTHVRFANRVWESIVLLKFFQLTEDIPL